MSWQIVIDTYDSEGKPVRHVTDVETPHLHIALGSALFRAKLDGAKEGKFQITAESK